jgi:hypothetical protein
VLSQNASLADSCQPVKSQVVDYSG